MNLNKNKTSWGWRRRRKAQGRHNSYRFARVQSGWLAGPASQVGGRGRGKRRVTRLRRSTRRRGLRLRRRPPSSVYLNSNFNFIQRASNSQNFLTISPNELILFALCSLWRNLAAHQRWDFSELFRISGDFQKCSWYFLFVLKIIFRGWGLSWGSPEGLWTSSALRQATATFSWCHFNICDFRTWIWAIFHAFKLVK